MVHIAPEQLETWPTKRLLGRLKALRRLEENIEASDLEPHELDGVEEIVFKADPRWSIAYKEVKAVLDKRENIRSGRADRLAQIRANRR